MEINSIYHADCIEFMKQMEDGEVNLTLTDIPYGAISRSSNGLRSLDKSYADIVLFDLEEFLNQVYRVTKGTIIIFCSEEQISQMYNFFMGKTRQHQGTLRHIIWEKTNPSPMNGQYIYLSGIENAVWFKKKRQYF